MKIFDTGRCALACVAVAMLAGCGRSQPPIGVRASSSQTIAIEPSRTIGHRMTTFSYQVLYRFHRRNGTHTVAGLLDVNGTLYGTDRRAGRDAANPHARA